MPHEEFAVSLDETTVGRELKKLGYIKLMTRPRHHPQNELAMEAFKKGALSLSWQRSEQSPARNAHRDMVPRRGARRSEEQDYPARGQARDEALGTEGPADEISYIFGAICLEHGKDAGLVLPFYNTETMSLHLTGHGP